MNLYLISQRVNNGYDTYDIAVVAAANEDEAREIHPGGAYYQEKWANDRGHDFGTWAHYPEQVTVELIGEAKEETRAGVICSSFNAG